MAYHRNLMDTALRTLEAAFRDLEGRVPPPRRKPWAGGFVVRYEEKTIHQAIVQKLARIVSSLHSIKALIAAGLFQEQGMVQRAVDEIGDDVIFLAYAVIYDEKTARHEQYLQYFWAEEFGDPKDIMGSHTSRGMVSRDKIRSYINQKLGADASNGNTAGKILTKAYSGFIHAASPHIMDMWVGDPPRFDIDGSTGYIRRSTYSRDAHNYFFRALGAMSVAAKAFGDDELFQRLRKAAINLQNEMD